MTEILLWLFVVNHGIACGAGLYESRMVVSPVGRRGVARRRRAPS